MPGMGAHGLEFAESANGLRSRAPVRPAWGWLGAGLGFAFTGWNRIGVSGVERPVPCLVWMLGRFYQAGRAGVTKKDIKE